MQDYLQIVHLARYQNANRKGKKKPPDSTVEDMRHRLVKCGVLNLRQLWRSKSVLKPKVPDWMYWALYHSVPRNSGK
jgi:hypothetical protein